MKRPACKSGLFAARSGHPAIIKRLTLAVFLGASTPAPGLANAQHDQQFDIAIGQWQLPHAIAKLNRHPKSSEDQRKLGIVAFHRGDYKQAIASLQAALPGTDPNTRKKLEPLLEQAKAGHKLFAGRPLAKDSAHRVFAVFANPKDEVLQPYVFDAIAKAQPRLTAAFGPLPSVPARFEFIQTPADLAKITDLPLDAVYKTGTIGITKYHRIMMASPRITMTGYDWIDTVVHEYVHFLVSIRTFNRTPVWLHEGLAKFFEQSWKSGAPPRISKTQASLLDNAFKNNTLVTLKQMHPSIALLPSQSQAALAYAEVQTMIAFLQKTRGSQAISAVLDQVAKGASASQAFGQSYKKGWDAFYADWKRDTAQRVAKMQKEAFVPQRFANPNRDPSAALPDVFSRLESGAARKYARLAVLLAQRGHEAQAIMQFEKALMQAPSIAKDPKLARRLGRLYLDQGQGARAWRFLKQAAQHEPDDAFLATLEAKAALSQSRKDLAGQAAMRALAINPMIPDLHCVLAQLTDDPQRIAHEQKYCGAEDPNLDPDP